MMNYHALLINVENHVKLFYLEHPDANLFYHNQSHTMDVLDKTKKIADHYQLDDRSFFIVCAAACFHDLGLLIKSDDLHELKSAELANTFLTGIGVSAEDVEEIKNGILATTMPQNPQTLSEKIICDADLYNLGTIAFMEKNKLLRKEHEAASGAKVDGVTWRASTIDMLQNHHYHTDYCQLLLDNTKTEKLNKLKNKQEDKINKIAAEQILQNNAVENTNGEALAEEKTNEPKVPKIKKKDRPIKGIETMFRISASNNVRISVMADNKAHIMISVNSIIISVVLGLIIKTIEENRRLLIPTIILLTVNVATIIYAVLATRPRVTGGVFTPEQVANKSVNLLFFGSFYNMNFNEYDAGIKAMMADSEFLYGSLTKDIFWQGKVLGRKYRLLRMSYTIFLYGIIAAVIAFSASIIFF